MLSNITTLKEGWKIRIGSHTDDNTKLDSWERWPRLVKRFDLDTSHLRISCPDGGLPVLKIASPYGGLIYLENPDFRESQFIKVRIEGAVKAPQFDLSVAGAQEKWMACR